YESAAAAARVPLYHQLVDPFTADEALWEFENLFVLSGETGGAWESISTSFATLKREGLEVVRQASGVRRTLVCRDLAKTESEEEQRHAEAYRTSADAAVRNILTEARGFISFCAVMTL